MQFPLKWKYSEVANLGAYQYSRMEDQMLGMEVVVHFPGGQAGDSPHNPRRQHHLCQVRRVEDFRTPFRR